MNNFGERLFKLRREKKLARDALGAKIGVSKTAIKNWEDGENVPKLEYMQALADFFRVDFNWLATGEGETSTQLQTQNKSSQKKGLDPTKDYALANTEPVNLPLRRIPILNWVQAGVLSEIGDDCYDEWEFIYDDGYGENVYGLYIRGNSMEPDFNQGDLIVVDQDREAVAGNFVIARVDDDNTATFKKYKPRGFDEKTGKEYFQLVPLNSFYPVVDSRFIKIRITGVVVEVKKKLV